MLAKAQTILLLNSAKNVLNMVAILARAISKITKRGSISHRTFSLESGSQTKRLKKKFGVRSLSKWKNAMQPKNQP
jgi:hypothetical protein